MFSPETQPIRRTIVREIVFNKLMESSRSDGESIGILTTLTVNGVDVFRLPSSEVQTQLEGLVQERVIEEIVVRKKKRWKVTEAGKAKLSKVRSNADSRIDDAVNTIFAGCEPIAGYREALLECLSTIFGRIADRYIAESISDEKNRSNFLPPNLEEVATKVLSTIPGVNYGDFLLGLRKFFLVEHPDADWLKWTYCKNYYALRIVGLGDVSNALSKEAFAGLTVYLDTNVILSALDKRNESHSVVTHVLDKLHALGCEIEVLEITAKELSELAIRLSETVGAALSQIPDELLPRTTGLAASVELLYRQDHSNPSAEEALAELADVDSIVTGQLDIPIARDLLIEAYPPSEAVRSLANKLKSHYDTVQTWNRRKSESAALHDALALTFVNTKRAEGNRCVFLTLDKSLPTFRFPEDATQIRPAITIDALLSWLGIILEDDESIERAYSTLLSSQLVTSKQTFSIEEFSMLAQVGMECKNMPTEDVEQCILYLRREAQGLDLRSADDREKLHHKVTTFFSSPDRKFLGELEDLRGKVKDYEQLMKESTKRNELAVNSERELRERAEYTIRETQTKHRLVIVGVLFGVGIMIVSWMALEYGTGSNRVQKILSFWNLFGLVGGICLVLIRVLCRGDLWPIAKRLLWPIKRTE